MYGYTKVTGFLPSTETIQVEELLQNFTKDWKSHGTPVKGLCQFILWAIYYFNGR